MDLNRPPLAAVQNRPRQLVASKPSGGPLNFTQYHTGWMDKQEAAFKGWLNAVLVPAAAAGSDEDGVHTSVQPQALAARRLVSRLRGLLWQLYSQDQNLISVMLKIEQRIDGGQLRMRDEESLMKNVKEGARARAVLASYHPLWLRLGMEVVVGVTVAGDDAPPTHAELAAFVRDHFLNDQQLAKLHPAGSKAYWASLAKLVLKRFLLLTALLDKALSAASLPSGAPLLFRKDSQLKASAQVLADFLLPRLTGEGDIVRTLGRLGYKLSYVQDPRWELDFAVNTMATDLRDGLRLCRLAELLTGHPRFFDTARFPSDRRPVRLANLQLALNQFARAGLPPQRLLSRQQQSAQQQVLAGDCGSLSAPVAAPVLLAASDLVDGDRVMTLCLLWHLILHFQLPQLISLPSVRAEIQLVRSKAAAAAAAAADAGGSCTASRDAVELFQKHELEGTAETAHVAALLEWCAAVCALYGLPVRSFGACFGDGSTFCLLVHHYLGHAYIALKDVYRQPPAPPTDAAGAEQACWSGPAQARAGQADGARRNFALVHQVVLSLGGIPPIVSAEDFLEHGHDEKGCILFTAFLCQRLLEISKEERAAMVVQRHWRNRQQDKPGTARQHLHKWIAAATVVQRAVRSWLLRRGLRRFTEQRMRSLNAVVRLQALWRGRAVRRQYVQLRQAAICVQAVQRGRQCRLYVFNHLLVPRMLSAGLHHKKQLESSRYQARLARAATLAQSLWRGKVQRRAFLQQRDAAVTVQAVVRGWLQQSLYQRQRQLAITVQALSRGRAVRRQLAQQQRAATSMQAVWRGWQQRQRFLGLRAAAVTVQSAWRARQARLLLSQHRAARQLQASWRGHVARRQVAAQRAAATAVQAAWRCYAARRAYQRQRSAAVTIQAAARMHAARARLLCSKRAVVCVQAAWRGFAVRHLLQRNQAATMIQCHVRGFQARCRLVQRHAAATAIQSAVRVWLAARHAASVAAVKRQMAEMAALMRQYQQRTAAARHIQAAYRGHAGRNEYRRRLAVLREKERMQAEREAAARAVITPWARTFVDRGWFLRAGKAVQLLQRWWKRQYRRRQAAAITIQANVRCFLAQRRLQSSRRAALVLQTAWRGAAVRASHPRCKQLADIRLRLAAAAANAVNAPHRSLGARTRAHLDALLTSKHPASAVAALTGLALSTEAVLACCDIVVAGGGLPLLLGIVRSPCRTKEAAEALRPALSCLANICRCRQHADAVFSAEGLLSSLGDHLQQQREKEELFMMVVLLWQRLVASPSPGTAARALALARQPEVLTKLEGVARLLALKVGAEQKYLTKLESSKGSDASARQATKALLSGSRQLRALRGVLAATGASAGSGDGKEELLQLGKNTLVRSVLHGHMT